MINIALSGAAGALGRNLLQAIENGHGVKLSVATVEPKSPYLGKSITSLLPINKEKVVLTNELGNPESFDLLIDFTTPTNTISNLDYCLTHGKKIVIGTTGFSKEQTQSIIKAGEKIPVVFAPNMSIGVNLIFNLLKKVTNILGDISDIEVIEFHHRNKKDSPSGTALKMGEIIASQLGDDLDNLATFGAKDNIRDHNKKSIGFSSIRAGDIVGEHTALFALAGEQVEITHKATSRMAFAIGAVTAAKWLFAKEQGIYSMQDVLGFS